MISISFNSNNFAVVSQTKLHEFKKYSVAFPLTLKDAMNHHMSSVMDLYPLVLQYSLSPLE